MAKDLNKLLNGYKSKNSKSILDCIQAGEPIQIDGISDIFEKMLFQDIPPYNSHIKSITDSHGGSQAWFRN